MSASRTRVTLMRSISAQVAWCPPHGSAGDTHRGAGKEKARPPCPPSASPLPPPHRHGPRAPRPLLPLPRLPFLPSFFPEALPRPPLRSHPCPPHPVASHPPGTDFPTLMMINLSPENPTLEKHIFIPSSFKSSVYHLKSLCWLKKIERHNLELIFLSLHAYIMFKFKCSNLLYF